MPMPRGAEQPLFRRVSGTISHGIETADSITCDAHKWLSVPMGCGMFFCRHRESVAQAFRSDVTYMPGKTAGQAIDASATFDPLTHSAQWSRRFIGLKLFMALARARRGRLAGMLEHQTRMGDVLRESLTASGWRIVNSTPLPVVCFTRDGLDPIAFLAALRERQIAWMSEATAWRRSGDSRMHHQLQNYRAGYRVGSGRDEQSGIGSDMRKDA